MPDLSDFRLGAGVVASDGTKVGTVVSVIVDEKGFSPRALVVKDEPTLAGRLLLDEKLFTTDEVVISITAVESATHDEVRLSMSNAEVHRQPLYLSYRSEPMSGWLAPVVEEGEFVGGGLGLPKAEEVANKPADQIDSDRGENVMLGKTGRRLGRVEDVLFDHGQLIGVVIRPEGVFKRGVVLPIGVIRRADGLARFAPVTAPAVRQLTPLLDPALRA